MEMEVSYILDLNCVRFEGCRGNGGGTVSEIGSASNFAAQSTNNMLIKQFHFDEIADKPARERERESLLIEANKQSEIRGRKPIDRFLKSTSSS